MHDRTKNPKPTAAPVRGGPRRCSTSSQSFPCRGQLGGAEGGAPCADGQRPPQTGTCRLRARGCGGCEVCVGSPLMCEPFFTVCGGGCWLAPLPVRHHAASPYNLLMGFRREKGLQNPGPSSLLVGPVGWLSRLMWDAFGCVSIYINTHSRINTHAHTQTYTYAHTYCTARQMTEACKLKKYFTLMYRLSGCISSLNTCEGWG